MTLLITTTPPMAPDLRVEAALIQTRRELEEAGTAIGRYYENWDDADAARAVLEALLRSIANLTLAVERQQDNLTRQYQELCAVRGRLAHVGLDGGS